MTHHDHPVGFPSASLGSAPPTVPVSTGSLTLADGVVEPCALALRHDGTRAYLTEHFGGLVHAVDVVHRRQIAATDIAVPFITDSCGIALAPDERPST